MVCTRRSNWFFPTSILDMTQGHASIYVYCAIIAGLIYRKSSVYTQKSNPLFSTSILDMGWLRLVGALKVQVSFAKEPYKRDDILQKKPIILRRLLIVATPYDARTCICVWSCVLCIAMCAVHCDVIPTLPWLSLRIMSCRAIKTVTLPKQKKIKHASNLNATPKPCHAPWPCLGVL